MSTDPPMYSGPGAGRQATGVGSSTSHASHTLQLFFLTLSLPLSPSLSPLPPPLSLYLVLYEVYPAYSISGLEGGKAYYNADLMSIKTNPDGKLGPAVDEVGPYCDASDELISSDVSCAGCQALDQV